MRPCLAGAPAAAAAPAAASKPAGPAAQPAGGASATPAATPAATTAAPTTAPTSSPKKAPGSPMKASAAEAQAPSKTPAAGAPVADKQGEKSVPPKELEAVVADVQKGAWLSQASRTTGSAASGVCQGFAWDNTLTHYLHVQTRRQRTPLLLRPTARPSRPRALALASGRRPRRPPRPPAAASGSRPDLGATTARPLGWQLATVPLAACASAHARRLHRHITGRQCGTGGDVASAWDEPCGRPGRGGLSAVRGLTRLAGAGSLCAGTVGLACGPAGRHVLSA